MKHKLIKKNRKKKGFTLIELLAVILILGVIALIAIPTITSIVEETRMNSAKSSAYTLINAVDGLIVSNNNDSDDTNDLIDNKYLVSDLLKKGVEIKGTLPEDGDVIIMDGKVFEAHLIYGEYRVNYSNDDNNLFIDKLGTSFSKADKDTFNGILYFDPSDMNKVCDDKKVNENYASKQYVTGITSGCMRWYVYSQNEDGSYNAILDHNIVSTMQWNRTTFNNYDGPTDILDRLKSLTDKWNALEVRNDKYSAKDANGDVLYTVDYTGYRARMISAEEILKIVDYESFNLAKENYFFFDSKNTSLVLPEDKVSNYYWLFNYTHNCISKGCKNVSTITNHAVSGYWTSTAFAGDTWEVWFVSNDGRFSYKRECSSTDVFGLRPVITIPKYLVR